MSYQISRKDPQAAIFALAKALNEIHDTACSGTYKHRDQSSFPSGSSYTFPSSSLLQVTATGSLTAMNTAEVCALVNDIRGVMAAHLSDDRAHKAADSYSNGGYNMNPTSALFITGAVDLASAFGTVRFLSGAYASHQSSSVYHNSADARVLSGVLASDISSLKTFTNSFKTTLNAHIFDGPLCGGIKLVD